MAKKKISELPVLSRRLVSTDVLPVVAVGTTYQVSASNLSVDDLLVNASATGTITIDLLLYSSAIITVTGNTTIAFSNLPASSKQKKFTLTIVNGGSATVTYPAGTRWGGSGVVGSAPTLQVTGTDKVQFDIYNNGSVVYDAAYVGRFA